MQLFNTKLIGLFLLVTSSLFAVDITVKDNIKDKSQISLKEKAYFGEEIFQGNFKENQQFRYNPNYILNVGDIISVKLWGAYEYASEHTVDKQGNIFIPKVGEVYLLGLSNHKLKEVIVSAVKKVFNNNVYVYADLKQYQPISVFVSGAVNKIGLYKGLSTDSILQFIDKAGGIVRGQGSYRHIEILRNKQVIKRLDLYQFLLNGKIDMFQFRNGDVILINPVQNFIEVEGEVNRPYTFELLTETATVRDVMRFIMPKSTANKFMLTKWVGTQEITKDYPLSQANSLFVSRGTKLKFFSNYYVDNLEILLEGEHKGSKKVMMKKGTSLYEVLSNIQFTPLSDIKNVKLYRKSVAKTQKQLVETMLKDLEARAFTSDSSTVEEANIRNKESEMIIKFVERARKIDPLGQVIISHEDNLNNIYLEEGDKIVIPKYSNIVVVQGEVNIPNALSYKEAYSIDDYIRDCGGYGERANMDKILLIKANGRVIQHSSGDFFSTSSTLNVGAGDSILVLGKTDSKNILITSSVTQILYQIAVGAAVVLRAF
ncbi:MAG: Capsular polysaccharide export system periplasmic protein KpsD [uncultured Sulfurovum sp.]|uniref:Capsular polysaccharide export system periplasmic protein KpsD n=1 Tax=uncultured Sulfurovum sp. TaxID=269237 RepID=A0A6S6RXL1_9BACT|nr:MAG: Capsular polysaccharide export system periplasmic protein KpsD [uncultured Sulfurovum sp.]